MKKLAVSSALAMVVTASSAIAADQIGTITATLDSNARTWFVTTDGEDSQSFFLDQGSIRTASIWGNPDAYTVATDQDAFLVSFTYLSAGGQIRIVNSKVAWFSNGQAEAYRSEEGGVSLTLESIEEHDDGVRVSGSFESVLAFSDNFGETFSAEDTRAVVGTFEAVLPLK